MDKRWIFVLLSSISSLTGLLSQTDTLVVGHLDDYQPYSSFNSDSNRSTGLLIDWWKQFGNKSGLHIQFVPYQPGQGTDMVTSGKVNVIAGVFADPVGMDSLLFVDYILRVKTMLYMRKDQVPKSVYEITDSIAILASSPSIRKLQQDYSSLPLKVYRRYADFIAAQKNREVAGYFVDIPAPLARIDPYPAARGYAEYIAVHTDRLRPAIAKDSTELLNQIQLVVSSFTDAELLDLANTHGIKAQEESKPWPFFVGLISLFVVIIGGMLLRFNKALQRAADGTKKRTVFDWKKLIDEGESDNVEFKSSMRFDHRELKANKALEYVIVKTMSSFLNAEGGVLFIGVNDTGEIIGIEHDYSVLTKSNADGFLLVLTNLINKHFGRNSHRSIHAEIINLEDKDICVIELLRHPEPIFLKKGEKEEFYVRAAAASVPLGLKETASYVKEHW